MKEDQAAKKKKQGNKKVQASLPEVLLKSTKYESNSQRKGDLDDALLQMLTTDMQPCSIVNDKGFNKFVNLLILDISCLAKEILCESFLENLKK